MLSIVCETPGTLRAVERPLPRPTGREVLLRVRRVGVCGTDLHIFTGNQPYLAYPRVMGHELSGVIETAPSGHGGRCPHARVLSSLRRSRSCR